jgi:hypothetical protein
MRAMVKIVVPHRIEAVAAAPWVAREPRFLSLVLGNDKTDALTGSAADAARDRGDKMLRRSVKNLLRRVETQPVKMKLVDPVSGVRDKEFADRAGIWSVEVKRLTPFVRVAVGEVIWREAEVIWREAGEIIPVRTEMIVDNVENDRDAERVRTIDKAAQIVGPS